MRPCKQKGYWPGTGEVPSREESTGPTIPPSCCVIPSCFMFQNANSLGALMNSTSSTKHFFQNFVRTLGTCVYFSNQNLSSWKGNEMINIWIEIKWIVLSMSKSIYYEIWECRERWKKIHLKSVHIIRRVNRDKRNILRTRLRGRIRREACGKHFRKRKEVSPI